MPSCVSADRPPKHEPITAADYKRLQETYYARALFRDTSAAFEQHMLRSDNQNFTVGKLESRRGWQPGFISMKSSRYQAEENHNVVSGIRSRRVGRCVRQYTCHVCPIDVLD